MRRGRAAAVVVAAGAGTRLGAELPKAFVPLAGKPMVLWSIAAVAALQRIAAIVVVVPEGRRDWAADLLGTQPERVRLVEGGATRAISVARGVAEVPDDARAIVVHDAARPLVEAGLVERVLGALDRDEGAIAAHPVADTLKLSGPRGHIARTVPREGLWAAETPQAFRSDAFREALARATAADTLAQMTDCAAIMEADGRSVALVESGIVNFKVTTESDLRVAEALLEVRAQDAPVD